MKKAKIFSIISTVGIDLNRTPPFFLTSRSDSNLYWNFFVKMYHLANVGFLTIALKNHQLCYNVSSHITL